MPWPPWQQLLNWGINEGLVATKAPITRRHLIAAKHKPEGMVGVFEVAPLPKGRSCMCASGVPAVCYLLEVHDLHMDLDHWATGPELALKNLKVQERVWQKKLCTRRSH